MKKNVIVSLADSNYFELLDELVDSIKVFEKSNIKIKKEDELTIKLEKNVDILNYVSNHNSMRPKLVIGFAAETNDIENNAIKKLRNKNCDMMIANDVSDKSIGFDSNFNEVTIFYKNNSQKKVIQKSIAEIEQRFNSKVVTLLWKFDRFYQAEDYHQDYYQKNFLRYLAYKKACQREEVLNKIWN